MFAIIVLKQFLLYKDILKFGDMHFIYQINRLTTTKVDSTYLG